MKTILICLSLTLLSTTALADPPSARAMQETNEEKDAKKANICASAIGKYKNKYKQDFAGEKKSLELIKGDDEDSAIPRSKKVKDAMLIEQTDDKIKMSIKGKKGQVVIEKKPSGMLSCSILEPNKPSKKPNELIAGYLKELTDKISSINGSSTRGKEKLAALREVARLCIQADGDNYKEIRNRVRRIRAALAAKDRSAPEPPVGLPVFPVEPPVGLPID